MEEKFLIMKPDHQYDVIICDKKEEQLEVMQDAVEGYIEYITPMFSSLEEQGYDVYCNEDGKLNSLDPNMAVGPFPNGYCEIIVGNLLFTRHDEAKTVGLSKEDIEYLKVYLNNLPDKTIKYNGQFFTIKYLDTKKADTN